ncbi:MAG: TerB family tellurite resistance protein [Steroidobacteraceae bacterium]|nr:TerB family tellurite resistance protein [Steroidobacteraceae bacterium]
MIEAIRSFFQQRIARSGADTGKSGDHAGRLAAAALMIEVVRADHHFSAEEQSELLAAAQRKFGLDPGEAQELIRLAELESREAVDLYQFTSVINETFSPERKVRLIEELWRVALADEVIHRYEEYVIRRAADLIYVPHSAFIAAKLRVKEGPK